MREASCVQNGRQISWAWRADRAWWQWAVGGETVYQEAMLEVPEKDEQDVLSKGFIS